MTRRPRNAATRPSAVERGDLVAEAALAALVERVGGERALRRQRPGAVGVRGRSTAARGRRRAGCVDSAPSRLALEMQSMPVSPPPITTTCLPGGGDPVAGGGSGAAAPSGARDPAVALVEVVHREVDAAELAARGLEVALDPRADRDHDRVVGARRARPRRPSPPTSAPYSNAIPSASSSSTRRSIIHFSSFASGTPKRISPPGASSRS